MYGVKDVAMVVTCPILKTGLQHQIYVLLRDVAINALFLNKICKITNLYTPILGFYKHVTFTVADFPALNRKFVNGCHNQ